MSFNRLHPALQYHIVNSLGWRELRPFQDEVISPVLDGCHMIILAPTAGGKTEAALFPVLSRMLSGEWKGLSVLYLCPIKALLNNLDTRLQRYTGLVGRRSCLWHGDIPASVKRRILQDPPDILLTTPESLEVMLTSGRIDHKALLGNLHVVIIDEVHAFAGDDRGWHLLCLLERLGYLSGRELQRLGLSATVGNPEDILRWMSGHCDGKRFVYSPPHNSSSDADVRIDYVGNLQNAALVISRLHRGEKRLVFIDSRSRAEQLANDLRSLEVETYVSHSSLSPNERRQAEDAFALRQDCVIVATSTLELGIDVGDLDRVIQIDAPATVSSFLQRIGRTGRRAGANRNCLFLTTSEEALLRACAIVQLWADGYVEAVDPPPQPVHILAQQLMALALQERGVTRADWFKWVSRVPEIRNLDNQTVHDIVTWMLEKGLLRSDEGIVWFGVKGQEIYGRRNFIDLLSVFTAPPLFTVVHGRQHLGQVDQLTFMQKQEAAQILSLGGRSWKVNHIDWHRRIAFVEPASEKGHTRWRGTGGVLGEKLCNSIKRLLVEDRISPYWSARAGKQMAQLRMRYNWLSDNSTSIITAKSGFEWWTFGGAKANFILSALIRAAHSSWVVSYNDLHLILRGPRGLVELTATLQQLDPFAEIDADSYAIDKLALEGLKFSAALPPDIALSVLVQRSGSITGAVSVLKRPLTVVSTQPN